jgi:hypothetical protein
MSKPLSGMAMNCAFQRGDAARLLFSVRGTINKYIAQRNGAPVGSTTTITERMQQEFRRRVKTQAALPNEGAVLRVFFGLWVSGQMKLHRIRGYRELGGKEKATA